ncbi:cytochrome P450 [Micromonospora sp. NPDC049645]|uniref:cytochrome P450 n=1 Tax=Micromonospora sp. NPDC049645 TaxID=3155508 RepID=UPI0034283337
MSEFRPERLEEPEFHQDDDRYRLWAWMRRHSPVHHHPAGTWPAFWSVTRYADVRRVYAEPETFSSRAGVLLRSRAHGLDPAGDMTMALSDPPRHQEFRALLAPHFDERSARALREALREDIRRVLLPLRDGQVVDVAEEVGGALSLGLICRVLGVPPKDHAQLQRWTHDTFQQRRSLTSSGEITRYLLDLMVQRMEQSRPDGLSALLEGQVGGELLTEAEILLNVENLVGASENAGLTITSGLHALIEHRSQWGRLVADPALVPTAIEEILRWTSSAVHSARTATRDVRLGDALVRAGDTVVLWLPSANRDERVFTDPDVFTVDRVPNRQVGLGFGPHVCIGATMARHQLRLLLDETADLWSRLEVCEPVTPLSSLAVQGPAHLRVRLAPVAGTTGFDRLSGGSGSRS